MPRLSAFSRDQAKADVDDAIRDLFAGSAAAQHRNGFASNVSDFTRTGRKTAFGT